MDFLLTGSSLRIWLIPALAVLFSVLPLKVAPKRLINLAWLLWLVGGISLLVAGANRLATIPQETLLSPMVLAGFVAAVAIGLAKGRFVLSKTSVRNLSRIHAMGDDPQPLAQVYSIRSWITIELMLVLSAALTWLAAPVLIRGLVNLAVGLALIASSQAYMGAGDAESSQPVAQQPSN